MRRLQVTSEQPTYEIHLFPAKTRSISLPLDLEAQITSMLSSSALNSLSRSNPNYKSTSRSSRPTAPSNPWDYKNIIEKLQVQLTFDISVLNHIAAHDHVCKLWTFVYIEFELICQIF